MLKQSIPSEEDINNEFPAPQDPTMSYLRMQNKSRREGAKWMRKLLTKGEKL